MRSLSASRPVPPLRPAMPARPASPHAAARRDPAPSLWAYRLQRMMLTPFLRALVRVGLPAVVILGVTGAILADPSRREATAQYLQDLRQSFEQRPEFMITSVTVEGCSDALAQAVRARLDLDLPRSSFAIDLAALQARIGELDAVRTVDLRLREGGTLSVVITERRPVAIWRQESGLTLIDESGHRVATLIARTDAPDLPLIAGEGADKDVAGALDLVDAAGPLLPRLRGLVRMGERRWDMVLDRGQRIFLPAEEPVRALERLLALDRAQQLLARDLTVVDLRLASRPTLRLAAPALDALARARGNGSPKTDGGADL